MIARDYRTLRTPWAPYGVTFSHDGTRLAIGGGSWYGGGGIVVVDLASDRRSLLRCEDLAPALFGRNDFGPTVSSVCFSPDDRHLLATTWSSSQHLGPTLVFAVDGIDLELLHALHVKHDDEGLRWTAPTAGVFHAGRVLVRYYRGADLANVVRITDMPRDWTDVDRSVAPAYLTGHRLVVASDTVYTGSDRLITADRDREPAALVAIPLAAGERTLIPARDCHRVTAIGATSSPAELVTGGDDGELDVWSLQDDRWQQRRIRSKVEGAGPVFPGLELVWATYSWRSIVGICSLAGGDRMASVSAGGELCVWDRADPIHALDSGQLPEPGTPRSIAAHPDRALVAVGIKQGGFGRSESVVVLIDLERGPLPRAWRTPAVLVVARAAKEQLTSSGAIDRATLEVLADALEQIGASERVLHHLRHHEARVRACWVVDGLLDAPDA